MMLLNQADADRFSLVLDLLLVRYAVIVGGALLLGLVALLVLRAWLRRGNRISDRTRARVHDAIDRRLGDRRATRAIARTTFDALARDDHRDDHRDDRRDDEPPQPRR
jgi:hypothetical protein